VLGALYDSYSYETNHLENIPEFVQRSLADLVRAFAPHRSLNRWLDVGFGAGTILVAAKRDGWEVHGLEKSRLAVVQARAAGFTEAREGDFLQSPYDVDSFDVVTLAGVVEHLVAGLCVPTHNPAYVPAPIMCRSWRGCGSHMEASDRAGT